MEKIRIIATGKVYELGNIREAVEARCSTLSGNVAVETTFDAAEKTIEKYRENDYDDNIIDEADNWVWTHSFKDKFEEIEEEMEARYGDLVERAEELIDKYDECTVLTGADVCFYCKEDDELYEDALDPDALGDYALEDDNLFYFVTAEDKFYLPEQVEVFEV